MRRFALAVVLLLAGCAAGADVPPGTIDPKQLAGIAVALKGLTPGAPQQCIDQIRVRDVKKFENTILYQYSPREIYRNDTSGGCAGLRYDDIIVSRSIGSQLCRGDIIRTVSQGSRTMSGSCSLGDFIPYRR